ncbi:hypothetical protein ABT001_30395 [Streptomyces sp. NPDC002793]|uniref:YncE family protein n=1 Tax=Streptomyces sp. NPDC002793 TaxID=3154432 RepID=UPI00332279E7
MSVLGTATNAVRATTPVGSSPIGVVASPDAARVCVTNNGSDSASASAKRLSLSAWNRPREEGVVEFDTSFPADHEASGLVEQGDLFDVRGAVLAVSAWM